MFEKLHQTSMFFSPINAINAMNKALLLLNVLLNKSWNLYFVKVLLEHDGLPHDLHLAVHLDLKFLAAN